MSAQAARTLVGLGYTDVWNLDGGMIAWENSGRPQQAAGLGPATSRPVTVNQ